MTARIHPFRQSDADPGDGRTPFRIGPWIVDPGRNTVHNGDDETRLHPKAMEVLLALAERSPDVVPREALVRGVWRDAFVGDEVLTSNVRELRRAFGDDARKPRFIETVSKRGY